MRNTLVRIAQRICAIQQLPLTLSQSPNKTPCFKNMPNTSPSQKNIVHGSITAGGNVHIGDFVTYNHYFAAQEVKIPHRLTNNIPTNADHILGRASELEQAKDYLAQHQATILFNGIGGIGKTALASKFMALYGHEYQHLAWITVQSTLAEAFTNNAPLLASLQITQQVQEYIGAKQLEKAFEYLFHQLNLLEHTLVVIDNANDLDDLDQYKNWFDTANCHFLITSRNQPSEWASVEVDSLPEDEAVVLFRKLHPTVSVENEVIKDLLSKLFYHTLLIELVAKAGAITGIPFSNLQSMIETRFIHHESLNLSLVPTGKHGSVVPNNVKKSRIEDYIWLIFSQVKGLNDNSKDLLKAMALLPVATPFDLEFLKKHFDFFNIPDSIVHLDALTERGWLQKEQAEGQKPFFKMHPLIGDVVVEQLGVDVDFAEQYVIYICNQITYDNNNPLHKLFDKKQYAPHAERLAFIFFSSESEIISSLLHWLNWLNNQLGDLKKAVYFGERAVEILQKNNSTNFLLLAQHQDSLAIVYREIGRYNESAALSKNSLTIIKSLFNDNHPEVATRLSNLALAYISMERFAEAAKLLEMALNSDISNFGHNHPKVAIRQSWLGEVYRNLGDFSKALDVLRSALSINISLFGVEHPTVGYRQNNLALVLRDTGNLTEARDLLEQALVNSEKNFGNYHPTNATYQFWLGHIHNDLGDKNKAQYFWKKSYEIRSVLLGEDHPHTIKSKQHIAQDFFP